MTFESLLEAFVYIASRIPNIDFVFDACHCEECIDLATISV